MTKLFAGLDVADQTTVICILDEAGNPVFEHKVETSPEAIELALRPYKRDLHLVGQESGTKANWLHKGLGRYRLPIICLDARHTHAALSARTNKTDVNDARGIAAVLQRGMYSKAYVKSDAAERIRLLLTYRKVLLRRALSIQLTLQISVKMFGARVVERSRRLRVINAGGKPDHDLDELNQTLIRARDALMAEVERLDLRVIRAAKEDPVCRRLMTIPAVGPIAALTFRAAIDDPSRFASSRTVGAYLGLTPRTYQSGLSETRGEYRNEVMRVSGMPSTTPLPCY